MCDFIQNCVPDCQESVLDCQKACVGNWESSVYVLHRHFGNPKCHFRAVYIFSYLSDWLFMIAANTVWLRKLQNLEESC